MRCETARISRWRTTKSPEPGGSARLDAGEAKLGTPQKPRGSARLDAGEAKLGTPQKPCGSARLAPGEVSQFSSIPANTMDSISLRRQACA
ncbi:hypothetical protein BST33_02260 [Mycolicibacter minnesotensis]|uniref:Uncharacterized protein n=1 Tax=Mycolicibacter minnesotensis TaxID=1118379 RepID=A0AA91M875_9MYCO|nr:hypothetical protein BST33_02260 [Mycolicibacter minnesotensis]